MLKLGNDIVNLSIERSKLKHLDQRFLNRVFTTNEQNIIQHAKSTSNKSKIFWAIWAAKEAAFKAYKKHHPKLIFSHRKFDVKFDINSPVANLNNNNDHFSVTGTVCHENKLLTVTWQFNEHTVHCIAVLLDNNKIFTDWNKINYNLFIINPINHIEESLETRFYAKQYLVSCGFDEQIEIIRTSTIVHGIKYYEPPMLFIKDQPLTTIEISLSHDHGWGAVVFANTSYICCHGKA